MARARHGPANTNNDSNSSNRNSNSSNSNNCNHSNNSNNIIAASGGRRGGRRRVNMVGVNMVLAEFMKSKHGLYKSCGMECFEGIMLEPYLLQPCFHVAGWSRRQVIITTTVIVTT